MFNKKIEKVINIEGMKCEGCVKRVENVLEAMKEVSEVNVSLENKKANIVLKKDVEDEVIKEKIEALGFGVTQINKI